MTSPQATVAVLSPGVMGAGVAAVLSNGGRRVVTSLDGRSEITRERSAGAGAVDLGSLDAVVAEADLVLSILPPEQAPSLAEACAAAMQRAGRAPLYADCNAVSPATSARIARSIQAAGARYVDGGIIGGPPRPGGRGTRLYVSGPDCSALVALSDPDAGLLVRNLGSHTGRASGLKMAYAALTKGTSTLQAAVLMLAFRLGLFEELTTELGETQPEALARMGILPFLPADAGRWIGEMDEIAATFGAESLPTGFHEAAAEVYRAMAGTPFAAETRETVDRSRTLAEAIEAFVRAADRQP